MNTKKITEMTAGEIWEGWCGNAVPGSDEGTFTNMDDALAYVRDRMSDWGNEVLEIGYDNDGNEATRYISEMTEDEINYVAQLILDYSQR